MNNKADESIWPVENVAYASRFYQLSIKSPCWRYRSMELNTVNMLYMIPMKS